MFDEKYNVRFYETDALGHVSNTVLVAWFESARVPIFKMFVPDMKLENWPLILASYNVDFLDQIYLQMPVQIKTWISEVGNSSFKVYQECWQDSMLKSKGITTLVHFDYQRKQSLKIPSKIRMAMTAHMFEKDS